MADEEEVKDAEEADGSTKGGGMLVPIAALVVVLLLGGGAAYFVTSMITAEEPAEEDQKAVSTGKLWERAKAHSLGDIMANVRGEGGRRYVKVTVQIWVPGEYFAKVEDEFISAILKEALEQNLHAYTMDELGREFIHSSMRKSFEDELNEQLRDIFGILDPEVSIIEKVVLNNLMVQ
jgi:flagellar basal body-associated protein FliL